ncbi:putative DNA-binding protein with PD1-like motif [Streptomyces umbrinus]|uniref:DNA-binding protein with PD1-like motif n=1 Tax=Streptomyces umbrinus TaxID=67370 RepID=A0ABU0T770_9ACTN|nr:PPC domain-containing DNA-binding protein [Streptomyces umbrinus]MDQ1031497.1 putative DNA-binding protein with PD1-like motif [Streptomyces umbrinus]
MRATRITTGRKFVLVLDHGDDFFPSLEKFCQDNEIRSGHIPTLIGGFRSAEIVGTSGPLEDPEAPLWAAVTVHNLEVIGSGTLAWDPETDRLAPHIHITTGLKESSAEARTSHLFSAQVQFIAELVVEEFTGPALIRPTGPGLKVPLLRFEPEVPRACRLTP